MEDPFIKEESPWSDSEDWDEETGIIIKEELIEEAISDNEYFLTEGELYTGSVLGQTEADSEGNGGVEEARQALTRTRQASK